MRCHVSKNVIYALAGLLAGTATGLFGGGGGMLLVPVLCKFADLKDNQIFATSVCIILPICIATLIVSAQQTSVPWAAATPYLIGGAIGGLLASFWGQRIPTLWLHRILGIMILWGGVRYLC